MPRVTTSTATGAQEAAYHSGRPHKLMLLPLCLGLPLAWVVPTLRSHSLLLYLLGWQQQTSSLDLGQLPCRRMGFNAANGSPNVTSDMQVASVDFARPSGVCSLFLYVKY